MPSIASRSCVYRGEREREGEREGGRDGGRERERERERKEGRGERKGWGFGVGEGERERARKKHAFILPIYFIFLAYFWGLNLILFITYYSFMLLKIIKNY